MQGSFWALIHATRKAILTDARNGLLGNRYAQATSGPAGNPGPLTDLTFRVEKNTFAKKKSLVSTCVGQRFRSVQEHPPGMLLFGKEFG